MLRKCKAEVLEQKVPFGYYVAIGQAQRRNMNISEKLIQLRKSKGMSQEEPAEKLEISRQAAIAAAGYMNRKLVHRKK